MENKIISREIMINRNGKPLFAVRIDSNESNDANYVYIENGDIKFNSSWMNSIIPYNLSIESHRLAKEIFTIGLQAAVKTKIYELKQLESILNDLNLKECLGNVMVDNTKLLLEVSKKMDKHNQKMVEVITEELKPVVEDAIVGVVRPIAIKKKQPIN